MKRAPILLLVLLTAVPVGLYVYNLLLLRPFVRQTPGDVTAAYLLRTWNPLILLVALALAASLGAILWRGASWLGRGGIVLSLLLLGVTLAAARFNHFEDMFHPLEENRHVTVAEVDFLTGEDMVMGVTVGDESRAWPVGILAYHHIVNDEVGGVPLVATY